PTLGPALGEDRYIDLMKGDKKAESGEIKFVLLKRLGEAAVSSVPLADLQATLAATSAPATETAAESAEAAGTLEPAIATGPADAVANRAGAS
ncbi:MAG: hypothetical protein ACRYHA_23990, partial [Janthinobacterium lividum]